jgi:hypothetical protein
MWWQLDTLLLTVIATGTLTAGGTWSRLDAHFIFTLYDMAAELYVSRFSRGLCRES